MVQLVDKYNPVKIEDFVGLAGPRALFTRLAAQPYSSAWLLVGPSGLGKTSMAFAFAKQIGAEIHHLPSQSCTVDAIAKLCEKCHYRPWAGDFHVAIIDEADKMSPGARLALLSRLDGTAAPPDTIFIFTANGVEGLAEAGSDDGRKNRFVSRCKKIDFTPPTDDEIAAFLDRVWSAECAAPPPAFRTMASASEGNVRSALNMLETEILVPGSFVAPAPKPQPSQTTVIAHGREVDVARSEASRRAWDTIRKKKGIAA
jgi:DNA polymerase III gamma/tau subunit